MQSTKTDAPIPIQYPLIPEKRKPTEFCIMGLESSVHILEMEYKDVEELSGTIQKLKDEHSRVINQRAEYTDEKSGPKSRKGGRLRGRT